jgi:hypothetical protein
MLKITQLIDSIKFQTVNPFVSKHLVWNKKLKVPVQKIQLKPIFLLKLINKLRSQQELYLLNIAQEKKSLSDFLLDKRINPRPDLVQNPKSINKLNTLSFTVACLPVKSENPLKNAELLPDLAEIALMARFEALAKVISSHFSKKTVFVLLHEIDAYGILFNISKRKRQIFLDKLSEIASHFDKNYVRIINWKNELEKIKNFKSIFNRQKNCVNRELVRGNKATESELLQIFPTVYMSINTNNIDKDKVFFVKKPIIDSQITNHAQKAKKIAINIMAFNQARKKIKEREILFPDFLKGSLTPSRGSWLFWPIGEWNNLYPHHGMGVLDKKSGRVTVQYSMNLVIKHRAQNIILTKSAKI